MFPDNPQVPGHYQLSAEYALEMELYRSADVGAVIQAFVGKIAAAAHGMKFICFLEDEDDQPSGALKKIRPSVDKQLSFETSVFSRRKNRITRGYCPGQSDKGVIVYDICETGSTIAEVAWQLTVNYRALPQAAIVYESLKGLHEVRLKGGLILPVIEARLLATKNTGCASHKQGNETIFDAPRPSSIATSLRVDPGNIESVKEGSMSKEKKDQYRLIAALSVPFVAFMVVYMLAVFNVIPRQVYNNIREYITVLGPR